MVSLNDSFTLAKLRIAYTGKNVNQTTINKEVFEKALPTIYNVPIVANYMRDESDIGGHDAEIVSTVKGDKLINLTNPVGVIPESADYYWEIINDNGVAHEYLCVDAILWKRQEAYQHIVENKITKQSMEITVDDGFIDDDGYFVITDMKFTAFCLLGSDTPPAFESASLITFSKDEYLSMLKECKEAYTVYSQAKSNEKEDECRLNKELFEELCAKYNLKTDELSIDYSNLTEEECIAQIEQYVEELNVEANDDTDIVEEVSEVIEDVAEAEELDNKIEEATDCAEPSEATEDIVSLDEAEEIIEETFAKKVKSTSILIDDFYAGLFNAVAEHQQIIEEFDGQEFAYPRYSLRDVNIAQNVVYFVDSETGILYGAKFSFVGDLPIVDFDSMTRKKTAYIDYVEPATNDDELAYEVQFSVLAENDNSIQTKRLFFENKELSNYKAKVEYAHKAEVVNTLLEQFNNKLKGNAKYEELKAKAMEYNINELETQLYALVGQLEFKIKEVQQYSKVGIDISLTETFSDNRYGDYIQKYK